MIQILPLIRMACPYGFEKLKPCVQKTNTHPTIVMNTPHGRVIQANFRSFVVFSLVRASSL